MKWWRLCVSIGLATTPAWAEVKQSDLDGDGVVALSDLTILLSDFGLAKPQRWSAEPNTVALWYLNGNGRDFSGNNHHLGVKENQVGWNTDAPHGSCAMLGEDGYIANSRIRRSSAVPSTYSMTSTGTPRASNTSMSVTMFG